MAVNPNDKPVSAFPTSNAWNKEAYVPLVDPTETDPELRNKKIFREPVLEYILTQLLTAEDIPPHDPEFEYQFGISPIFIRHTVNGKLRIWTLKDTEATNVAATRLAPSYAVNSQWEDVGLDLMGQEPGGTDHFQGVYTSLSALQTAVPVGNLGDYADVDTGTGTNAIRYIWDAEEGWIAGSSTPTTFDLDAALKLINGYDATQKQDLTHNMSEIRWTKRLVSELLLEATDYNVESGISVHLLASVSENDVEKVEIYRYPNTLLGTQVSDPIQANDLNPEPGINYYVAIVYYNDGRTKSSNVVAVFYGGTGGEQPGGVSPLGTFITTDFNEANWEKSLPQNSATAVYSGDKITANGGDTTSLRNALIYKGQGSMSKDRFKITALVKAIELPAEGGIGLGVYGAVPGSGDSKARILGYCVLSNNPNSDNRGVSYLASDSDAGGAFALGTGTGTGIINYPSNGDTLQLTLEFNLGVWTYKTLVLGSGESSEVTLTEDFTHNPEAPGFKFLPYNNYPGIFLVSGQWEVTSFTVSTTVEKNAELALVGDSKTQGYNVGAYSNRITDKLSVLRNTPIVNLGGAGDRVAAVMLRLKEIQQLAPKRIVLCIGRNDDFDTTFQAAYQTLTSTLQGYGITVYHAQTMAENGKDNTALRDWIAATYGADVIDTYTPTLPYDNPGDGVHISAATAQIVANTIHAFLPAF